MSENDQRTRKSDAIWSVDFETAAHRKTAIIRDRRHRGMRIAESMNPGFRKRALLIARAPEMLGALEIALAAMNRCGWSNAVSDGYDDLGDECREAHATVEQVIAGAKGE